MTIKMIKPLGLALVLGLGLGNAASAQQQPGAPEAPAQQAPQQVETDFSDSELQSFVDVQTDLQVIRVEYSSRLEETDDPEVAAQLQEEASQEMVGVLESSELDVDTYNQIAMALQQDQELLERVQSMLN